MSPPSDHLLRTLAAVPVSSTILDVGCGAGRHTEPLLRLGFPVHACDVRPDAVAATRERIVDLVGEETAAQCVQVVAPDGFDAYPDDAFNWVVAFDPVAYVPADRDLTDLLQTMRRLLVPGGWVYVASTGASNPAANGASAAQAPLAPDALDAAAEAAGLASAVPAERAHEEGTPLVRAIFRHVTETTPR